MTREQAKDKIAKLLALAGSPNEHEAFAALTAAQRLALKYGLDVEEELQKGGAEIYEIEELSGAATVWKPQIALVLADNLRGIAFTGRNGKMLYLIALPDDYDAFVAAYFYTCQYYATAAKMALDVAKRQRSGEYFGKKGQRDYLHSHLLGFTEGLKKAFEVNVTEYGLVLYTPDEVQQLAKENGIGKGPIKHFACMKDAYATGKADAAHMKSPQTQVSGAGVKLLGGVK